MSLKIEEALQDRRLQENLPRTLEHAQAARARAVEEVENWEDLRTHASRVKGHTLDRLDDYLIRLEKSIEGAGGKVVWANDAAEAIDFILQLLHQREATRVVKSKSMTTEEVDLNAELEKAHISPRNMSITLRHFGE